MEGLGIDLDAQDWQRSGDGDGAIEIAFIGQHRGTWHGVGADARGRRPGRRVLVYDRNEWECFLDGVRAASSTTRVDR